MTNPDTVERIRRANPVPDADLLHQESAEAAALFSSIERRKAEMLDTKLQKPQRQRPKRLPWHRRSQLVFAAALIVALAVIVPVALWGDGDPDVAVEPTTPPAPTAAPAVDEPLATDVPTPEVPPLTVAPALDEPEPPPVESPPEDVLAFDEIVIADLMASGPRIVTGPDGLPVILYYAQSPEHFYEEALGPAGYRIVVCRDAKCSEVESVDVDIEGTATFATLLPDGSPVFVGEDSEAFGAAVIHVCTDSLCSGVDRTVLETANYLDLIMHYPHVVGAESGHPVLYFQSDAPPTDPSIIRMICSDRACTSGEVTTLFERAYLGFIAADGEGRLAITFGELDGPKRAALCDDFACSDGPTLVDPAALEGFTRLTAGGFPPPAVISNPDESATVEMCMNFMCTEVATFDLEVPGVSGAIATAQGSDGLPILVYDTPSFDSDGKPIQTFLMVAKCRDAACTEVQTSTVAILISEAEATSGRWWPGSEISIHIGESGLPMIAYGTLDGLHLIRCQDQACTPPE